MTDAVYSKKMLINLDMGNNEIIGFVPEIVTDLPTTDLKVGRIVVKDTSAYICVATAGDVKWKELTSLADGEAYVTESYLFDKTEGAVTIKDALIPTLAISKISGLQVKLDEIVQSAEFADIETPAKSGTAIQIPSDLAKYDNTKSAFITKAVADLENYYDKTAVDNKINAIKQFNVEVVEELPETGASNTIYFVPQSGGAGTNIKDEYMWIDKKWELIGTTEFTLTITQTADGITINSVALQDATASQDGLMTKEFASKLDGIEEKAEVNIIETVKVGGTALTVSDKAVDIPTTDTPVEGSTSLLTAGGAYTALADKVDKETGKRLMTEDEGTKLAGIDVGAQVNVIESVEVAGVTATISDKKATIALPDASESASGLMPASAVTKLGTIEEGANKTVVDTTLTDEGTNPVQGKVVKEAIDAVATELTEFKALPFGYVYTGTIAVGVTSADFALPDSGAKEVASVTVIDSNGAEVIPAIIVGTKSVKVAFNSATTETYTVKVIVY